MLIILRQPPIAAKPTKSPLHHPPSPVYLEPRLIRTLAHHLQNPPAMTPDLSQQNPHPVGRISPHLRQTRQRLPHTTEHFYHPLPVHRRGRQNGQPQRVNQQMPLTHGDFSSLRCTLWGRRIPSS